MDAKYTLKTIELLESMEKHNREIAQRPAVGDSIGLQQLGAQNVADHLANAIAIIRRKAG